MDIDILFIIGLGLIFIGNILIVLSAFSQSKKIVRNESGFVIVVWPFFVIGGSEKLVQILIILVIILLVIIPIIFLLKKI